MPTPMDWDQCHFLASHSMAIVPGPPLLPFLGAAPVLGVDLGDAAAELVEFSLGRCGSFLQVPLPQLQRVLADRRDPPRRPVQDRLDFLGLLGRRFHGPLLPTSLHELSGIPPGRSLSLLLAVTAGLG